MSVTLRKKYVGDRSISKKNRPYKFQLDIYRDGKRRREVIRDLVIYPDEPVEFKKEKQKIAENIRSTYQIEVNNSRYGFTSSLRKRECFIDYYEKVMASKSVENRGGWESMLRYLKAYESDSFSFETITLDWVVGLVSFMSSRLSPQSCNTYLSRLKSCLNQAKKERIISENPCDRLEPIRFQRKQVSFLTEEEIKMLIETPSPNPETKKAFLFCCFTGLRQSDVRKLKWKNVQDDKLVYTQKKTKKAEVLPLSPNALAYLGERGGKDDYVFKLCKASSSLNRSLMKWVEHSELGKRISFHSSRHTFATLLITHGANIYTVSKLLGHSDIKSTMIYAKVVDKEKEKAVLSLPQIFVVKKPTTIGTELEI